MKNNDFAILLKYHENDGLVEVEMGADELRPDEIWKIVFFISFIKVFGLESRLLDVLVGREV